jgi:hypothetical protein
MRRAIPQLIGVTVAALVVASPAFTSAEDVMVFTANQNFLSRIYLLDKDGGVIHYHQYDFYRWVGMEVVDGQLYVADAFAPRVYMVDPVKGDLEVFIDDWSLYYFYDVAFDGTYFYVDEWDLNRYDINGDYAGTASFDEDVLGCAWDGSFFWTLDDTNLIKCWDLSGWPTVTEISGNNFTPPSPQCRGLFFDGEYFWSAESGDSPGLIYRFDHSGTVMEQWPEPAFSGWAAAFIKDPATGVESREASAPITFGVESNRPNPFNPTTTIRFIIPGAGFAELSVYDATGKKVETLLATFTEAGLHEVMWHAVGRPSGVYWAVLRAGGQTAAHKMVVLK